jgi:hypothetical protein
MSDIESIINKIIKRRIESSIDSIAKKCLVALRNILDQAGFREFENLKNYEVYVHVSGESMAFEILVDFESFDDKSKKLIEDLESKNELIEKSARSYGFIVNGIHRIEGMKDARKPAMDARRPARDARRPARDARENSNDRSIKKEIARIAPRSLKIDRSGKLSMAFQRSMEISNDEFVYPEGDFQGLIKEFMNKVKLVVSTTFKSEIKRIFQESLNEKS